MWICSTYNPHGKKACTSKAIPENVLYNLTADTPLGDLTAIRAEKEYRADILSGFLFEIGEYDILDTEWSDSRFHAIVERITVYNDGRLVFTFRNGSEETVMM